SADLAVEEDRPLGRQRADVALLVRHRMGAKLDYDLSRSRGFDEPMRAVHHLLKRLRGRQAGEHDVRLGADLGRGACRDTADFLELGERAAAIAEHAVAALDQIFRSRQPDLADADEADRLHALTFRYARSAVSLRQLE